MIVKSKLFFVNSLNLLLDLSSKKKRILFLTFLIMTFLFSSTAAYGPGSQAFDIQNKSKPPSYNVELVGMWPYGACLASAVDITRNIALIGNGYTLQVLDISKPSSLSKIGEVTLNGNARDIAISGNYAYVVTHHSLKIIDISNLNNPHEVGSIYFQGSGFQSVALSSGYAYVAASGNGLIIYNVSDPEHPTYQANYAQSSVNDVAIWGNYAICEREYWTGFPADLRYGLVEVIDVSNPSSPSLTGTYQAEAGYKVQGIDVSDNGYAYTCQYSDTDKSSKIIVIDVATNPASPSEVGSYLEPERNFDGITLSGNYAYLHDNRHSRLVTIDISTPSSPSYVGECETNGDFRVLGISGNFVGISHGGNGFSLYDVSDPANPSRLGNYDTPDGVGFGNPIVASGDNVYIACKDDGLRVMDVSNPSNPFVAGICEVGLGANGVAVSGKFAYCTSSCFGGRLYIVDISSPESPYRVAHLQLPSDTDTGYEPTDVAVRGDYAYVSGNKWISGETWGFLTIVDISNPLNPDIIGSYGCPVKSFHKGGIALSGNYAYLQFEESPYVGVHGAGLRVIDISDPTNPTEAGHYFSGREDTVTTDSGGRYSHPVSYGWSGTVTPSKPGYAFSPSSRTYTSVTSDQENQDYTAAMAYTNILPQLTSFAPQAGKSLSKAIPIISGVVKTGEGTGIEGVTITFADACGNYSADVVVRGNYAYLAGGRFIIIDISDPENPTEISSIDERMGDVLALSGDYAYLGNLTIIDISNPSDPKKAGYYYGEWGGGVAVSGNFAYVPGSLCILKNLLAPEISITDPSAWETLYGVVSIEALASHSSGISRVEFYIDDELQSTDYTSPYIYTWNTISVADGPHKIRARAYNNNGKSSDSEIEVTVQTQRNLNIYSTSGGTTDPETGTYSYGYGAEVTITAFPDSGYRFSGWTGDVPSGDENDNPLTITMDSDRSITANFSAIPQYTLTIAAETGGTTTPAPGTYTHDSGTQVTITAVPNSGYDFSGWSGSATGATNPITITMDSNKSITANFSKTDGGGDTGGDEDSGPCFIATAAYGSALHPHVDVLRDFRDKYLMPSKPGRSLVKFYYRYSPFAADLIAKHKALKAVVRASLLPLAAFSYSLLHFGPIITAVMPLFIFGLPVFIALFFRRKMQ